MKKLPVIILSLLLLFTVTQTTFAKNNVELNLRYYGDTEDYSSEVLGSPYTSNKVNNYLGVGVSGSFDINNKFALAGEAAFIMSKGDNSSSTTHSLIFNYSGEIDAKFYTFKSDFINLGLQAGLRYLGYNENSTQSVSTPSPTHPVDTVESTHEISFLLGIYGDINISKNLSLYADLKVPFAYVAFSEIETVYYELLTRTTHEENISYGFRVNTLRTVVGMKYNIASGFYIGLEVGSTIKTSTTISNYTPFSTIRLNLGYQF